MRITPRIRGDEVVIEAARHVLLTRPWAAAPVTPNLPVMPGPDRSEKLSKRHGAGRSTWDYNRNKDSCPRR